MARKDSKMRRRDRPRLISEDESIRKDFSAYKGKVLGVLLFGSKARGEHNRRSDTDICLVAGGYDPGRLFQELIETDLPGKYDVKIFEMLPQKMKGSVLENHRVILSRDAPELSYYLLKWKRMWEDQKLSLKKLGLKVYS